MVEADGGYSHPKVRTKFEEPVSEIQYIAKARARARHETVNGLLKIFGALGNQFHHNIDKHGSIFRAIAVITQLKLKYEQPTFHVRYPAPGNYY